MKIKDRSFKILIQEEDLQEKIAEMAEAINSDYKGKAPLFIGILNGSFMFVADMMKHISLPSKVSFIKVASYTNMKSSGSVKQLIGLSENIFEQDIVILEDIIDSGTTMSAVIDQFKAKGASSVTVATLLLKPKALKINLDIKYVGFEIGNKFVVGYGLDYDGLGRNSGAIYQLK